MAQGQNRSVPQLVGQMQNPVAVSAPGVSSQPNDGLRIRHEMLNKIFVWLQQRQPTKTDDASKAKLFEVAKRLENAMIKTATSKEEYLDFQSFEVRIKSILNQMFGRPNNPPSSAGMMVQTPGASHGWGQTHTATPMVNTSTFNNNNNLADAATEAGRLLPTNRMNGGQMINGRQQLSANTGQQMMPTPGFNNSANTDVYQSHRNGESSRDGGKLPAAGPEFVSQSQLQRQRPAGSDDRLHYSLNQQLGGGFRSNMHQNAGVGMSGNSVHLANGHMGSQGGLSSTNFSTSSQPLQQQQPVDQLQQVSHVHRYSMSNSGAFGSGNLYGSSGSVEASVDMNSMSQNPMRRVDVSFGSNQSSLPSVDKTPLIKHQQFENGNFQSSSSSKENVAQMSHQPLEHQFNQPSHHCQYQQQEHLVNNDAYRQPQRASNIVSQVKHEPRAEYYNEAFQQQAINQVEPSKPQNQYIQNAVKDDYVGTQSSSQLNISQSFPAQTHQTQQIPQWKDVSNLSGGVQPVSSLGQWHSPSQNLTQTSKDINGEREQFGVNSSQILPIKQETTNAGYCQTVAPRSTLEAPAPHLPEGSSTLSKQVNGDSDSSYVNQRRWLLFLLHVRKCNAAEDKCESKYCFTAKTLLKHIDYCKAPACAYQYCLQTRKLIHHNERCENEACPVCVYVKNFKEKQREKIALLRKAESSKAESRRLEAFESMRACNERDSEAPSVVVDDDDLQPSPKRVKVEKPSQFAYPEPHHSIPVKKSVGMGKTHLSKGLQEKYSLERDVSKTIRSDVPMNADISDTSRRMLPVSREMEKPVFKKDNHLGGHGGDSSLDGEPVCVVPKQEKSKCMKEVSAPKEERAEQSADVLAASSSGKSKIKGVSLIELFTPEQVEEHIRGLRQWVGQSKTKAEKNKAMGLTMSENSCQLCAVERLAFEPTPIYCTPCGARIKRNAMHYTVVSGESRHYVCIPCYNEARTNTVSVDGTLVPKSRFEKKKNDEEVEEPWVQCDKCQAWQHQICALFNGRRNHGQAEYTCPNCYIEEVERGERKPVSPSVILGAQSLPASTLSNHLEQRLFKKLKQERQERARLQGKSYDEVPGADSLVIRVVASIDKMLEVKPRFLDIFREENYSSEFPYKSKAILLFQKIEGVEVCLFGMYVQEFGTDSASPNQRRVYLSYLDSVKYFRPDVRTVSGEALRTFVYHEILIGYLDYCKKRGFSSCYIWACPPLKGEDYILYCHPEIQKTPKTDKLREWYLAMLRKASKEKVVVECTNFYDHFFVQSGECRAKVTAARLPYFDGDYWPGAAEDLIEQMSQEEDGKKSNRKVISKKVISKRALKAVGQLDLSVNASKDLLLMHKLGEIILPMKEDFIMVHLQHCCKHCCTLMVSGYRWVCNQCKNFQICDNCHEVEKNRVEKEKHPVNQREKHVLYPIAIEDVPTEIKDSDDILESEFFDTRQAFLSLCQGNHYQYDTLRRAKHSSMMILYHLHNPTVPAFATACAICQQELEPALGWRCEVCPDYEVCSVCYSKGINHPHSLINRPAATDSVVPNTKTNQTALLRELLLHMLACCTTQCQYPRCRAIKLLVRHGLVCKTKGKGCIHCKKMWAIFRMHARNCRDSQCRVPKCRDLRAHDSRKQQQADSRRRAAVKEMVRQRAADASTSTSD
ncbi:Histone acetyltransferase HAC5 [Raphanus sativus]|uniref:histone acetyltransferase n=1 Tax=Raphanus sativus TaxID=3726 RepID=A0A9W3BZJ3_RAPSA|nr:histone acetyltransferase HAC5-like [Raphanus sativus]KAJ4886470.1 Histone acetyltransferase HAC5 [Raphanus sativus]